MEGLIEFIQNADIKELIVIMGVLIVAIVNLIGLFFMIMVIKDHIARIDHKSLISKKLLLIYLFFSIWLFIMINYADSLFSGFVMSWFFLVISIMFYHLILGIPFPKSNYKDDEYTGPDIDDVAGVDYVELDSIYDVFDNHSD